MNYIMLLFFTILQPIIFYSVDPTIEVTVNPPAIGTNETAEIRVNVLSEALAEIPMLSTNSDKFTISYKGSSSQRQLNIINGIIEVKHTYSYIFNYIPKATGEISIPTFTAIAKNGNRVYSPSASITVEATGSLRNTSQNFGNNPFGMFFDTPSEAFLQLNVTKNQLAQNTGLIADLYLYSDDPNFFNTKNIQQLHPANFDGGLIHSLSLPENNDLTTEQFGMDIFYGKIVARFLVFPLEKGTLYLSPPVLYVQQRLNSRQIVGDPVAIESIPLTDQLTYIGNEVTIITSLPQKRLAVSEEYPFTFTIEGDGNVDFFVDPFQNVSLSNLFISSPTSTLELGFTDENDSNQIYMKKIFTYTIIPKTSGTYTIPSINLSFADTNGQSTNAQSETIVFEAIASTRYLSTNTPHTFLEAQDKNFPYRSGTLFIIIAFILGSSMMLGSFFKSAENKKLATDTNYARTSGAKKRLHKILKASEEALKNKQYKDVARLIRQSILYFCADKFSLSNSSSPQEIVDFLTQKNIDFSSQKIFVQTLSELDFYAFASAPSEIQIKEYLSNAYQLLDEIDKMKISK